MSFYSEISSFYEKLFPIREQTLSFLLSYINEKSSVLDIGCGTGNYVREISQRGINVAGLDINKEMIREAMKNCSSADFYVGDIFKLNSNLKSFNVIYSIGNVLSYFTKEYLREAIPIIEKQLNWEGVWIFQIVNWDKILIEGNHSFPVISIEEKKIEFNRKYNSLNNGLFEFVLSVLREQKLMATESHILTPYKSEELIFLHNNFNFELSGHFGNFKKDEYSIESPANIFVFKKKNLMR